MSRRLSTGHGSSRRVTAPLGMSLHLPSSDGAALRNGVSQPDSACHRTSRRVTAPPVVSRRQTGVSGLGCDKILTLAEIITEFIATGIHDRASVLNRGELDPTPS